MIEQGLLGNLGRPGPVKLILRIINPEERQHQGQILEQVAAVGQAGKDTMKVFIRMRSSQAKRHER